jgi:ABC-type transporter Mla subunit MlaD
LNNAAGLKPGDPVKLMGFNVGQITEVKPNDPGDYYGVTVYFKVQEPNYGYIWLDSKVRVAPADFLGNRNVELIKGSSGAPTVLETNKTVLLLDRKLVKETFLSLSNKMFSAELEKAKAENSGFNEHALRMEATMQTEEQITNQLNQVIAANPEKFYQPLEKSKPYWIEPLESPALTERLETVVNTVEKALPSILDLTNKISDLLASANSTSTNLNHLVSDVRPTVTNLAVITENLRDPHGSLGEWLLPTNLQQQVHVTLQTANDTMKTARETLATANSTLSNTDTNITSLVSNLNLSLENLANLTSNLNSQVQVNSNILSSVSKAVVDTDDLVQGLKRHWLFRSAFKESKTKNANPPAAPTRPLRSPRDTK